MPLLTDLATVRTILDRDRAWSAYAIGDLAPGFIEHCEWHATLDATALLLLYRGFDPPITFAIGDPANLRPLYAEIDAETISLHVQPAALEAMRGRYVTTAPRLMRRMVLSAHRFAPVAHDAVRVICESDLSAVRALYQDGHDRGEGPTFFHPAMLRQHSFRGVWESDALIAIAGTHLYSADLGVAAIGNVYTRHDRRGRGLAAQVTSAVVAHALAEGIPTVVLNVAEHNASAQRVYERLGFAVYCEFFEGEANRA